MDTYLGHVRTPADAIKLFEACRLGVLPRVQRRLSEKERQSIKSGSVFVWDEQEAGMKRWTDGKSWSASRVSGSFLTYREMEGKRGGGQFIPPPARVPAGQTPDSGKGSDEDLEMDGDGPDGYRYKPNGLMKQSFSITTSAGRRLHLISYYSRPHANSPELPQPTSDPQLRSIIPAKGMYPESTIHEAQGPAVTRAPMQQDPYMQQPHPHMHPSQHRMPYGYSSGYSGWPPSPVSTPPYPHHQQMYPSQLPPPPPGSMHPASYQMAPGPPHTSPYQAHQYHPHHRPMHAPNVDMHGPPQRTIYDRPPPSLSNSSLPPPPPHSYQIGAPQQVHPAYQQPHQQPSSLAVEAARMQAEHHAVMAQRALSTGMIDPRLAQPAPLAPVNISSNGITTSLKTTPPPRQRSISPAHTPKNVQDQANTSPKGTPNGIARSEAQTIPSISSLVHASNSTCVLADNKSNSSNNSRAGSTSPRQKELAEKPDEERKASGGTDIPTEKLITGMSTAAEDRRTVSILDRKFMN